MASVFLTLRAFPLLLTGALAVAACGRPPAALAPADAGIDAAADATTAPLRQLTSRRLFGQVPVRNGVVDPTFSTLDHVSWSPYSYSTQTIAYATPLHLPTPTGMPALRLTRRGTEGALTGLVRSAAGPVEVSLWCGGEASSSVVPHRLSLIGLYAPGQASADFDVDPHTPAVTLGEILWTRYVATLDEGPMGWASLRIVHRMEEPLFVSGPALVERLPGDPKWGVRRVRTPLRPLTPEEQAEWTGFFSQFRERFGGPDVP